MSLIEQTLVEHLSGVAGVTALVSTRIFAGMIPQGTELPCISFQQIGGGPVHSLTNPDTGSSGLDMTVYRFDIWGDKNDRLVVLNTAAAVKTALDGYRGAMGTTYQTTIQRMTLHNTRDDFEPDSETYRRMLEFDIDYNT